MTAWRHRVRVCALEAKYELFKQLRIPATLVFSVGFPIVFYSVFGLIFGRGTSSGGIASGAYYIATYGAFGVIGAALYGTGVGIALERGQGWMLLKRASPMPLEAYILAKLAVSLLLAFAIVVLLGVSGGVLLGVRLSAALWIQLAATMVAGALPFCALGLAIGWWAGPNSAVAVVNLINIPAALLSGLWIPLDILPPVIRSVATFLPPYHYSQLALAALGGGLGHPAIGHVMTLAGFAVLCLALAFVGYRRDEGRTYG